MIEESELVKEIASKKGKILSRIDEESIAVYLFLKKEYEKGNIGDNKIFQFMFKSFYGMNNAGLGDKLKARYFKLLEREEDDLGTILSELHKIETSRKVKSVQFSFATKLLHTINDKLPIFDTEVSKAIHCGITGNDKDKKIASAMRIYKVMQEELYPHLLDNKQIKRIITEFKNKFKNTGEMSEAKILDFILWQLGKMLKEGVK